MKKNIRYLIIMLAVLVVLGGGAAVLLLTQPAADEDASSSSSVASEMVTDRETSEVATVTVENPNASYVMVPVDDGTATSSEESSSSSTSVDFTIDGYQSYDVDISQVTAAVNMAVSMRPARTWASRKTWPSSASPAWAPPRWISSIPTAPAIPL